MFDLGTYRGWLLLLLTFAALGTGWYFIHPESLLAASAAARAGDASSWPIIIIAVLIALIL